MLEPAKSVMVGVIYTMETSKHYKSDLNFFFSSECLSDNFQHITDPFPVKELGIIKNIHSLVPISLSNSLKF